MDPTGRARDVHFRQIRKCFFYIKKISRNKGWHPYPAFRDLSRPLSTKLPNPTAIPAFSGSPRLFPAFSGRSRVLRQMLPITYLDSLLARLSLLDATDAADAADVTDRSDAIDVIEASIPGAPRASLCGQQC